MSTLASFTVGPFALIAAALLLTGAVSLIIRKPFGIVVLDLASRSSPLLALLHLYWWRKWMIGMIADHGFMDAELWVTCERRQFYPLLWIAVAGLMASLLLARFSRLQERTTG